MRLLGGDDVEPSRMNNEGPTPLARVVQCGYVGPMKTQLGFPDVDLNLGDRDGCSLPSRVPEADCEGVLRMLNGANIDPNPVMGDRLIPFSRAAAAQFSKRLMDCGFPDFPRTYRVWSLDVSDGRPGKVTCSSPVEAPR